MNKANLDNIIAMCNAVKATNDYPPTILVGRSLYEQHKDFYDGLDADIRIIEPMAGLVTSENVWVLPHDWKERYHYE